MAQVTINTSIAQIFAIMNLIDSVETRYKFDQKKLEEMKPVLEFRNNLQTALDKIKVDIQIDSDEKEIMRALNMEDEDNGD